MSSHRAGAGVIRALLGCDGVQYNEIAPVPTNDNDESNGRHLGAASADIFDETFRTDIG